MVKDNIDPFFFFKCGVASFFANYVVGIFHPLELLKTRLQSRCILKQVMMEVLRVTKSRSMMESSQELELFTEVKDSLVFLKEFI